MKRSSSDKRQDKRSASGSQRRLALAVLLVLMLGGLWLAESDSQPAMGLRDRIISAVTGGSEETPEEPGEPETGTQTGNGTSKGNCSGEQGSIAEIDPDALPEYNGEHYVQVNGGVPAFPDEVYEKAGLVRVNGSWQTEGSKAGRIDAGRLTPYEYYGELDSLGRCTVAYGCLGEETMPAEGEERGDISKIHPSGWAKAQGWERCHLIAWALSDENANERNLVTGTHYMNHDGMRPLEEETEHYIWNTGGHVLYMVRPWYSGDELVPRGVQMTAWSCEDQGEGVSFNVYCFNVTPGSEISYVNGVVTTEEQAAQGARLYVLNTRSGVFHYPSCDGAKSISKKNRKEVTATRVEMTDQGYIPCGYCEP